MMTLLSRAASVRRNISGVGVITTGKSCFLQLSRGFSSSISSQNEQVTGLDQIAKEYPEIVKRKTSEGKKDKQSPKKKERNRVLVPSLDEWDLEKRIRSRVGSDNDLLKALACELYQDIQLGGCLVELYVLRYIYREYYSLPAARSMELRDGIIETMKKKVFTRSILLEDESYRDGSLSLNMNLFRSVGLAHLQNPGKLNKYLTLASSHYSKPPNMDSEPLDLSLDEVANVLSQHINIDSKKLYSTGFNYNKYWGHSTLLPSLPTIENTNLLGVALIPNYVAKKIPNQQVLDSLESHRMKLEVLGFSILRVVRARLGYEFCQGSSNEKAVRGFFNVSVSHAHLRNLTSSYKLSNVVVSKELWEVSQEDMSLEESAEAKLFVRYIALLYSEDPLTTISFLSEIFVGPTRANVGILGENVSNAMMMTRSRYESISEDKLLDIEKPLPLN